MAKRQDVGLARDIIDKYYTSPNVVKGCMDIIEKNVAIDGSADLCIEPSAGDGAFTEGIMKLFRSYRFYDIDPAHPTIVKQDYLLLDNEEIITETYNKIHVIGNPPFGRQSSTAIKFIKKSCEYCDTISFILPKSFKKESMRKYFPVNFHLKHESDLQEYSFLVDGKPYDVPCVFQIWEKRTTNRMVPKKMEPKKFEFVKKNDNPHISFRRVGVYAGKIDRDYENKSIQSHYFIKFKESLSDEMFHKLSAIEFKSKNNTVGPRSISKQELAEEYNKIVI